MNVDRTGTNLGTRESVPALRLGVLDNRGARSVSKTAYSHGDKQAHHDRLAHVLLRDLPLVDDLVDGADGQEAVDDAGALLPLAMDPARGRVSVPGPG